MTSKPISNSNSEESITILGIGSLLSERSSRVTFPNLSNFRSGRIPNYRRVFGHAPSVFFQNGIANSDSLEMASLSAECVDDDASSGFICAIFEVPNDMMMKDGTPSMAFLEREEEFDIASVSYIDFTAEGEKRREGGILCTRSTDESYIKRWGQKRFEEKYAKYDMKTIWGWKPDSGLRPCAPYLRHCVLAAKAIGEECYDSFLDETFLVDRTTTIRSYLDSNPQIMATEPPPALRERYGG
eukprot:CAMPEP_0178896538 /NCGR_PEP_ID=MMETSP0786-20121207/1235_1 /TAXON_ID=186022 /ORGANISM="Thalassionema frauenfeldii, Strain CCMP 1798" /LENGTH=241 /DNA_ID=CAMNT_0020566965 /DNA_START=70 /DNA_END=795 /DNA_ORIENTATION=-